MRVAAVAQTIDAMAHPFVPLAESHVLLFQDLLIYHCAELSQQGGSGTLRPLIVVLAGESKDVHESVTEAS